MNEKPASPVWAFESNYIRLDVRCIHFDSGSGNFFFALPLFYHFIYSNVNVFTTVVCVCARESINFSCTTKGGGDNSCGCQESEKETRTIRIPHFFFHGFYCFFLFCFTSSCLSFLFICLYVRVEIKLNLILLFFWCYFSKR